MACVPNQMSFHIYADTRCLRDCLGSRVMEGWVGQNGIHRGIGGELRGAGVRVRILQRSGAGVTED